LVNCGKVGAKKGSSFAMVDFKAIYLGGAIPLVGRHFKP
tara:strand:- start:279 stop:395 length:117 start_codon:yes stop_codon:yes gene_type:complete